MNDHPYSTWLMNLIGTGTIFATIMGYMPSIGAGVAAIYYVVQIIESPTVQRWIAQRRVRKLARLKARVVMLEAQDRAALLPSSKLSDEP